MPSQVTPPELFEKIGRFYVQSLKQEAEIAALRQQNTELSRAAGEALRTLELLGRKDLADKITKGDYSGLAEAVQKAAPVDS